MAQFTASAFVDLIHFTAEERIEFYNNLPKNLSCYKCCPYKNYAYSENGVVNSSYFQNVFKTFFDCGTDINLFLELAQMRNDIWENQWVVGDDIESNLDKMWKTKVAPSPFQLYGFRRATPQEVYEHLK